MPRLSTITRTAVIAGTLSLAVSTAVSAADVSVSVNGNPVTVSPPPISRAGRVFVPLRGIFERLGASVVYSNGTINATGNNRTISLRIGSNQAQVDGASQTLDVAPFIIGASTYVPLRFVSQALGANVNYDGANHIVAISTNGQVAAAPPVTITPQPAAAGSPVRLSSEQPGNGSYVESKRPTVEARFKNGTADPNTLHVSVDGLDVTGSSTRAGDGIVYSPPSDLLVQKHTVRVTGKDTNGAPIDQSWSFTSGTAAAMNVIDKLAPAQDAQVGSSFTVSGHTLPNSRVHIVAGASAQVGGIFAFGTGNYTGDTTSDASGNFSQEVSINAISGGVINLVVTSTEPQTKSSARATRRLLSK
jgi:hypothetical protein